MYLLDTNVVSELRKIRAGKGDANVAAWTESVDALDLYVSVITLEELERGTLLMLRRDAAQGGLLRAWVDQQVLPAFAKRILPIDTVIAQRCARLHVPDMRPTNDALIAATALVHRMTIITRNVSDFTPMGVPVLNPWLAATA